MKCLMTMKKSELQIQAIKMRCVLIAVLSDRFDHVGAIKNVAEAALCDGSSLNMVERAIDTYSVKFIPPADVPSDEPLLFD